MKSAPVAGTIIRRRSEDLIATTCSRYEKKSSREGPNVDTINRHYQPVCVRLASRLPCHSVRGFGDQQRLINVHGGDLLQGHYSGRLQFPRIVPTPTVGSLPGSGCPLRSDPQLELQLREQVVRTIARVRWLPFPHAGYDLQGVKYPADFPEDRFWPITRDRSVATSAFLGTDRRTKPITSGLIVDPEESH
jgi:hypothetical protein